MLLNALRVKTEYCKINATEWSFTYGANKKQYELAELQVQKCSSSPKLEQISDLQNKAKNR